MSFCIDPFPDNAFGMVKSFVSYLTQSHYVIFSWVQHFSNFDGSLYRNGKRNLKIWHKANRLELLIGIWNAVVINPAQGYLLEFRDKHKEQSTNWSSTDSAPRLPTKHLLAKWNPQPVHIVVMGTRRLNIYCCSAQNDQRNASITSVIRLTSQMCSRTMKVWWNSSSLRDICPPIKAAPDGLVMTTTTTSWVDNYVHYVKMEVSCCRS